jgi:polysaccharide biosynthesis protein PslH
MRFTFRLHNVTGIIDDPSHQSHSLNARMCFPPNETSPMRLLLLFPSMPFPATTGQKHRFALVAKTLAAKHDVALACFAAPGEEKGAEAVAKTFSLIRTAPIPLAVPVATMKSLLKREPSDVAYFRSAEMERHIAEIVSVFKPEAIIVGDPALTPYVAAIPNVVRVLDYVCEVMLQMDRLGELAGGFQRRIWQMRRIKFAQYLKQIRPVYDLCILNSQEDLDSLARLWPRQGMRLITNGLAPSDYPMADEPPERFRLIYPGSMSYAPNKDAVEWFATDILPKVREAVPQAHLVVTGPVPKDGERLEAEGLAYLGFVDDVKREIARSWATIVPLRLGAGGARFKVLESLALGAPMISTAIGYEGLAVTDGIDIVKAEGAENFAKATIALLTSPELRNSIALGGRALIEKVYNWDRLGAEFESEIVRLHDMRLARAS